MMDRGRNFALFVATSALFGTSAVGVKVGVAFFPPVLLAALRFLIGGAIFLPILASRTDDWRPQSHRDWVGVGIASVLVVGAQNAFVNVGAQYVPSGGIGIMFGTLPILTPIAAAGLLTAERISVSDGVGILVGFIGVLMVVQPTPQTLSSGDSFGYILVFVGMAALALGTVLSQRVDPRLGTLPITAWGMVLGGIGIYATSLLVGEQLTDIVWTTTAVLTLVYLSTAVSIGGYVLYFGLIRRIGSNRAALMAYLAPIIAGLTGFVLLEEVLEVLTVFGFVVIFVGFVIIEQQAVRDSMSSLRATLSP